MSRNQASLISIFVVVRPASEATGAVEIELNIKKKTHGSITLKQTSETTRSPCNYHMSLDKLSQ